MITKRYEAETLNEALVAARAELGENVVVLHSKRKVVGGIPFLGNLFGRECYEVLVGVGEAGDGDLPANRQRALPRQQPPAAQAPPPIGRRLDLYDDTSAFLSPVMEEHWQAPQRTVHRQPPIAHPSSPPPMQAAPKPTNGGGQLQIEPFPSPEMTELRHEIQALKESMANFAALSQAAQSQPVHAQEKAPDASWTPLVDRLTARGVELAIAQDLVKQAQGSPGLSPVQALRQTLTRRLAAAGGVRPDPNTAGPAVFVFLGPTGVGKTTSIAKIAAGLTLVQNYQVCLASADTYRIAAVEQLKVYAEIIGTPLEVLYGVDDVPQLMAKHANADIILVDTAGRSPKSKDQMRELAALVEALNPQELHFVVGANLKPQDSLVFLENFPETMNRRLLVTKLDETQHPGVLINLMSRAHIPLSYATMGQSVPDDIAEPSPAELAAWVMGEEDSP